MGQIKLSLPSWDFENRVVAGTKAGQFIGSHNVLICAGPPVITPDEEIILFPIGLNETFSMQQVKELQRIAEIGSKMTYFVVGRTFTRIQMATVTLDVENILKALYKYYIDKEAGIPKEIPRTPAHSGKLYLNLASDFFDRPVGLLLWIKNNKLDDIGLFYLEECYVSAHNFNLTAGGLILAEGVIIETYKITPMSV